MRTLPRIHIAALASIVGAGVGLLGMSVNGIADMAQSAPVTAIAIDHHERDCPRLDPAREL